MITTNKPPFFISKKSELDRYLAYTWERNPDTIEYWLKELEGGQRNPYDVFDHLVVRPFGNILTSEGRQAYWREFYEKFLQHIDCWNRDLPPRYRLTRYID